MRNLGVREYEGLSVAERNKNAFEHKLYRDIVQSASSCNLCRLIHLALERGKNKLIHHMEFLFDASTPLAETRVLLFGNDDIGGWSDWRPGREYGRWGHGKPDEGSALRRRLHSLFVSCRENEGTLHVYAEEGQCHCYHNSLLILTSLCPETLQLAFHAMLLANQSDQCTVPTLFVSG